MPTARQSSATSPVNTGFTLIELLITVAIMVITLGVSISAFIRFNERQQVETTAKQIQTMLRNGQAKAQIREMPVEDCGEGSNFPVLRGYIFTQGGTPISSVFLKILCQANENNNSLKKNHDISSFEIPDGIVVEKNFNSILFLPLTGKAEIKDTVNTILPELTISVSNESDTVTYEFTVNSSGTITDGGFIDD